MNLAATWHRGQLKRILWQGAAAHAIVDVLRPLRPFTSEPNGVTLFRQRVLPSLRWHCVGFLGQEVCFCLYTAERKEALPAWLVGYIKQELMRAVRGRHHPSRRDLSTKTVARRKQAPSAKPFKKYAKPKWWHDAKSKAIARIIDEERATRGAFSVVNVLNIIMRIHLDGHGLTDSECLVFGIERDGHTKAMERMWSLESPLFRLIKKENTFKGDSK